MNEVQVKSKVNLDDGSSQERVVNWNFPSTYEEAEKLLKDTNGVITILNQQLKIKVQAYIRGVVQADPNISNEELQKKVSEWDPTISAPRSKKDPVQSILADVSSGKYSEQEINDFLNQLKAARQAKSA